MDRGTCQATVTKELDKTYRLNNDKQQQLGEEDFGRSQCIDELC